MCSKVIYPIEIKDAPAFIRRLQDINNTKLNTIPPDKKELRSTVKPLKNHKSTNNAPSNLLNTQWSADRLPLKRSNYPKCYGEQRE